MAKIISVLYDDPVDGYPKTYARDTIPVIKSYPDGQTTPTPSAIDFKPGELARQRQRRPRAQEMGQGQWPSAHCHLGQGRSELDARQGTA